MAYLTPAARSIMLALFVALPAAASAQQTADTVRSFAMSVEYDLAIARLAVDFWTPRLNAYKIEVDKMLSAADLVDVNELRTRAALLFERIRISEAREREREVAEYDSAQAARNDAAQSAPTMTDEQVDSVMALSMAKHSPPADSAEAMKWMHRRREERERYEREYEIEQAEKNREDIRTLELVIGGNDEAIASLDDDAPRSRREDERLEAYTMREEMNQIRYVTGWVARNYRPGMEELMARVFDDLGEFFEASRTRTREFYEKNRAAILEEEWAVARILANLGSIKEMQSYRSNDRAIARMVNEMLEACLLLYNGQDLREILMIDGMPLASGYAAEGLPAGTSVGQNIPNPASTRTTIPYTLSEPGTRVVIQLLDTRGTVVATFDQGAREAGDHSATIDLASLTPGTYLYQLRITTAASEKTSSRGMQVVR